MTSLTYYISLLGILYMTTILMFFISARILQQPKLAFYARLLVSYLCLLLAAAFGVVVSILLRIVGYGQVSQWAAARCFKWLMWFGTGVMFVVVEGEEYLKTRPAVFVGNHQTELDVLMLGSVFPPYCAVTAKKSLKRVPVLGWFMALSKTVFIDRSNRQTAVAAFDGAATEMRRDRQSVYIFPEGTRSYSSTPDLLPFKKGAFHLAIQAQVPVVPLVSANYAHILDVKKRRFESGLIPVKVLKPIETRDLTAEDVDELTKRTREVMLEELKALSGSTVEGREWNGNGNGWSKGVVKEIGGREEGGSRVRVTAREL